MKKVFSALLALALMLGLIPMTVFAYRSDGTVMLDSGVYDKDGDPLDGDLGDIVTGRSSVDADFVAAGTKFYVKLTGETIDGLDEMVAWDNGNVSSVSDLADNDYFTFRLDRDENGKYLDSVKLVTKRLDENRRRHYIEVELKETKMSEDKKVTFDAYFKAKNSVNRDGRSWNSGDIISIRFALWVDNREEDGEDATIDVGEGIVFNPVSNAKNTITWGGDDDIASLEFEANDDADKFFAKLSTKVNDRVYREYGDPADADLFFRTFTGRPSIDSTSRGTLTLYNPWSDEYDRYYYNDGVDPRDCYIYSVDRDGYLEDITDRFTYVDEDETESGIDGWQTRVRTLGSYVISDRELDTGDWYEPTPDDNEVLPDPSECVPAPVPQRPRPVAPQTGASDYVAGALALICVSLAGIMLAKKQK